MITHLLLLSTVSAMAAMPPVVPPQEWPLESMTIVYDVRDLSGAYEPAAPSIETGLAALEFDEALRGPSVDDVVERIRSEIAPETWGRPTYRGGSSLRELAGNLVITTSMANHERIEAMVTELRSEASLQILIDVLVVIDGETPVELPEGSTTIDVDDGEASVALLDREQVQVLREAIDERGDIVLTSPRLLVRNGRAGSVIVGSEHAMELGIVEGPRRQRTAIVHPLDGVALSTVARAADDRRSIRLELSARTAEFADGDPSLELAGQVVAGVVVKDGGAVAIRIPRAYARLCGVNLDEDGRLAEIVREPLGEEGSGEGDVLIVVQPRLVGAGKE